MEQSPRGTRDILPGEIYAWQYIEKVFADLCHKYGFAEIRIPTFEHTSIYERGVGDTSDIVKKEMYTFNDKGGRSITLRPEGTAGVVRSFIEHGMSSLPYPLKFYYMLNLFRYERVAKGRYREFHQLGVEAFGSASPNMDIEIIALLYDFFQALGLKNIKLKLNSIGNAACRKIYDDVLRSSLQNMVTSLCSDCQERFAKNPLRILDCKIQNCQKQTENLPRLLEYLDDECKAHHEAVCKGLDDLGIEYEIDPDIVRGLDYYTKTVFEFTSENVGTQGTICGGGRYDSLVHDLGGEMTPAVGFAIGQERLLMELEAQGILPQNSVTIDLYIATMGNEASAFARKLVHNLRQKNIYCEYDLCERSLKAQMKYADKLNCRYCIVIGEQELIQNKAVLKDMSDKTKSFTVDLRDSDSWFDLLVS